MSSEPFAAKQLPHRYFCTYFDQNFVPRALALYRSIQRTCPSFTLYCLCMDEGAYSALAEKSLEGVIPIALQRLERWDPRLLEAKANRSIVEYYFTCTSNFCTYLLDTESKIDLLTYLDADLYFFASPEPLFDELGEASVGIIEHRFSSRFLRYLKYGKYNVGWITFRRDEAARACLQWWRERCLEWCYDRIEGDRFADQKYLDRWPEMFENVRVIDHKGANVATWNVDRWRVTLREGRVFVDEDPLIFFHFSSFKQITDRLFRTSAGVRKRLVRRDVYGPYIRELKSLLAGDAQLQRTPRAHGATDSLALKLLKESARFVRGIFNGEYLLVIGNRIL